MLTGMITQRAEEHTNVAPVALATWRISSFLTRLTAIAPASTKY